MATWPACLRRQNVALKQVFKPGGSARAAKEVEDEYNEIMAAMPNEKS